MSEIITVDIGAVRDQAHNISAASNELHEMLVRLGGQMQTLAASYQSASGNSVQALYQEWQQGAAQIQQAMDGMSTLLTNAAEGFVGVDGQIKSATGH